MNKRIEATGDALPKSRALSLDEVGNPGPVELVSETDVITGQAELAAFMEEKVKILIYKDPTPGAYDVITITVNGLNQSVVRGIPSVIKRKYVESLARGRTTFYRQHTPDSSRPEMIQLVAENALTYPFEMIEDKNPRGRDWLNSILRSN